MVYIELGKQWVTTKKVTLECIDKVAFHEVFELLLMDMRLLAEKTFSVPMINKVIHNIIRIMENTFFNYIKDKGGT